MREDLVKVYDEVYRTAKVCHSYAELTRATGLNYETLKNWGRKRRFPFKQRQCMRCGDPISTASVSNVCTPCKDVNKNRKSSM